MTLLDPVAWPAAQIATLYLRRWRVEMNFDDLKTFQELAVLRCQSPHKVLRELVMHAIAYNLIRHLMLESSLPLGKPIERQSYKGTLDILRPGAKPEQLPVAPPNAKTSFLRCACFPCPRQTPATCR
jgi:hypothetical protein